MEDDRDRMMYRRPSWMPWAFVSLALMVVAFGAYSLGMYHSPGVEIAEPGSHSWHLGFPGFIWFFLFLWIFAGFRRMWWCGGYPYGPWRYRRYRGYRHAEDQERDWEDWHRREHERMDGKARDTRGPGTPVA